MKTAEQIRKEMVKANKKSLETFYSLSPKAYRQMLAQKEKEVKEQHKADKAKLRLQALANRPFGFDSKEFDYALSNDNS